jgi:hypothetical protein
MENDMTRLSLGEMVTQGDDPPSIFIGLFQRLLVANVVRG